jgi:hypothetical protein
MQQTNQRGHNQTSPPATTQNQLGNPAQYWSNVPMAENCRLLSALRESFLLCGRASRSAGWVEVVAGDEVGEPWGFAELQSVGFCECRDCLEGWDALGR